MPDLSMSNTTSFREALAKVAKIYDPLGLIGPVTAALRRWYSEARTHMRAWNDLIGGEAVVEWNRRIRRIPKVITMDRNSRKAEAYHIYCDASIDTIATVAYGVSDSKQ